jgi:3-oxoacyl-[acyl-carrier protein] reductase
MPERPAGADRPLLEGRRVVVTGAGRGIGRAIARACLLAGARVGVHYRTSEAGALSVCAERPDRALPLRFDVRDPAAVAGAVAAFRARFGGLDGWVNNAAVSRPALLVAAEDEALREQVEVNVIGPLACARAVLPVMLEQRSGVILNVSSVAAARPARGQAVYAATKAALESLTRALAVEYGRKGIRAHSLRPGPIDTDMLAATKALAGGELLARVPLGRLGTPEEVAAFAVFLLSDRAAYATGGVHAVDGGYGDAR